MGFTIDELNGYKAGERYEKHLEFVKMFGNAKTRYIVMKDENGNELHWTTNDYTKTYKNFKLKAIYKFTIKHIIKHKSEISIERLTLVK